MRLVAEIARRSPGAGVFLQLDVSGTGTQGGCAVSVAPALLAEARQVGLDVKGCMAIGPQGPASEIRRGVRRGHPVCGRATAFTIDAWE